MRSTPRLYSRLFFLCSLLWLLTCSLAQAQTASSSSNAASTASTAYAAGKIDLMEGDVRVFDKQNVRRTVKVGDKVYEGDNVVTGANGEIHLTMEDEGFIAVRPNTKMRIIQYRAEGDDNDKGVIGLLAGSLRSITGWIGKYHPKSYSINTPTATIGIRGTDHEPKVIPEGSSEGDAGTYDKVNAGGSFINTPQGNVDVTPNHAAFAPHNGKSAPRMLAFVPTFFHPTRNEHLIEGKHDRIQHIVQQRRDERVQQIRSGARPARPLESGNVRQNMQERGQARQQQRQEVQQNRQQNHEQDRRSMLQTQQQQHLQPGQQTQQQGLRPGLLQNRLQDRRTLQQTQQQAQQQRPQQGQPAQQQGRPAAQQMQQQRPQAGPQQMQGRQAPQQGQTRSPNNQGNDKHKKPPGT